MKKIKISKKYPIKNYNVILDYLYISTNTDSIDLSLDKLLLITLVRYKCDEIVLPFLQTDNPALDYNTIIGYWNTHKDKINFINKLDYLLVPMHITNTNVILGIILFNTKIYNQNYIIINSMNLISKIINNNIVDGLCVSSYNESFLSNLMYCENITWLFILKNIKNYLPKLNIIEKCVKENIFNKYQQTKLK